MKLTNILAALLLAVSLGFSGTALAAPDSTGTPSAVVKNFYATLTETMKQGNRLGFSGRYKKLAPTIQASFNLPLMTRVAVGPTWLKANAAEQKQLISAFSDFSIANYASQFSRYDGEHFAVTGEKPAAGGGTIVETRLQPKDMDAVALNYLMKQDDQGHWRIVDVFLDGAVSELATRRAEFSSIVEHDGIPALVNQLDSKSKQMGPS